MKDFESKEQMELRLYKQGIEDVLKFLRYMNANSNKQVDDDDAFTRGMAQGVELATRHTIGVLLQVNRKGY